MTRHMRFVAPRTCGIAGFTLTEMLATLLILTLASTLMATGIPAAIDAYQKVVKISNAQLALSTTLSVVRSEIGLATHVEVLEVDGGKRIYYYDSSEGCWASIGNSDIYYGLDKIYYKGLPTLENPLSSLEQDESSTPLVSNQAISDESATGGLRVSLMEATRESDQEVDVRIVVTDSAQNVLASVGDDGTLYRILTRFVAEETR